MSVPATLQATIAARIDRLPPEAKRTLSAAAVIGSRFNLDLLTQLGVEPVVADLVAAQFIDQVKFTRQPEYVFHHPLIRAVAYEAQLKSDRADVHRRLAAAIEQRDHESVGENAALIAEHLEAAGDLGPRMPGTCAPVPGPATAISAPHGSVGNAPAGWRTRYRPTIRNARRCASPRERRCVRAPGGSGLASPTPVSTSFVGCAPALAMTCRWRSGCTGK